jgi:cytochrome c oxidase subunit 2
MSDKVSPLEKQVIAIALLTSAAHLALIAYAAVKLGIGVPTCVTSVKPFDHGQLIKHAPNRYEVHVVAKMWAFEPTVVRIPTGSTVEFFVTSKDVNHGFHVRGTNVNLMAVPNLVNAYQTTFSRAGKYPITCHEYCGSGHQDMHAIIEVTDDLAAASTEGLEVPAAGNDHPGKTLYNTKGCVACHSLDGSKMVGPTFKGLWESDVKLADGTSVKADAAFLREMIANPNSKPIEGFSPVMPKLPVTDAEMDQLIEFIKTLK